MILQSDVCIIRFAENVSAYIPLWFCEGRVYMNIYDISQMTGFSTATVSRVINGSSNVSEKTREKVLAVIEEYGYTPNVFARGLGLNTMKTIGVMCTDSSDRFMAQAIYFLEEYLRKCNYDLILCCTGFDHEIKQKQMKLLLSKRVDAVVLVGSSYAEDIEENNRYIIDAAKTVPVMMINGMINAPNIFSVVSDDYTAVYDITDRLINSGKKKPLYIYNSTSNSAMRKLKGFRDAMAANGLEVCEDDLLFIEPQTIGQKLSAAGYVKEAVSDLEKRTHSFDCAIASDDILAVGALKFAKASGLKIPEDFAVTGYNNFDICECCEPELTSIDNHLVTLCEQCVAMLMQIFSDDAKSVPKQTLFACEIVERGTTMFS